MKHDFRLLTANCKLPILKLAALFLAMQVLTAGCGKSRTAGAGDEKTPEPEPVAVETAVAVVLPMDETVSAQGTIAPAQGAAAKVAAVTAGRLAEVRAREGDRVSAGQVVATVDLRPQQAMVRSAAAAVSTAEAQARSGVAVATASEADHVAAVRLSRIALRAAQTDRESAVKLANNALHTAQVELQKTRAGSRPQELAQAEQTVRQASATKDRAVTELERQSFLFEKGIAARRQLEDARTALTVADSALESAKQQLNLLRAGARPEDLNAAELKVDQARDSLQQSTVSGDAKVDQARATLRQAEQGVLQVKAKRQDAQALREAAVQKRADLAAAAATAQYAEIRSPMSGIVTRRALNPGDLADPSTPIFEIADLGALNLVASVTAEDGAKIRTGMAARVSVSDSPGKVYGGRVITVGQVDPQSNLQMVRISVAKARNEIKSGTFATATIVVRTNPRAVGVPKQAVLPKDVNSVVFIVSPDEVAHRREVITGIEQGDLVEITKGIRAGQKVVRLGNYTLSDGARVREADSGEDKPKAP